MSNVYSFPPAPPAPREDVPDDDTTATVLDVRRAVYTVSEVSAMLSLSRGGTYAMVRSGEIPSKRIGNRWVIPKARFHAWLNEVND